MFDLPDSAGDLIESLRTWQVLMPLVLLSPSQVRPDSDSDSTDCSTGRGDRGRNGRRPKLREAGHLRSGGFWGVAVGAGEKS